MSTKKGKIIIVLSRVKSRFEQKVSEWRNKRNASGKVKYFCIGRNKTGTTSLERAFDDLGYSIGNQRRAEILTGKYYFEGKFQPIIDYCDTAQVFQDVPFSYPETYKYLDTAYPNSKFILTVRDDAEQWYRSITRFHAKKFGKNGNVPTASDLRKAQYVWPGFMYNAVLVHGTKDEDPYNKEIMIAHYERFNRDVVEYFKNRPDDLLVINVAEKGAYQRFAEFINAPTDRTEFPWENKT